MACPIKNSEWNSLVNKVGEETAYRLFLLNGNETPTLNQVTKTLDGSWELLMTENDLKKLRNLNDTDLKYIKELEKKELLNLLDVEDIDSLISVISNSLNIEESDYYRFLTSGELTAKQFINNNPEYPDVINKEELIEKLQFLKNFIDLVEEGKALTPENVSFDDIKQSPITGLNNTEFSALMSAMTVEYFNNYFDDLEISQKEINEKIIETIKEELKNKFKLLREAKADVAGVKNLYNIFDTNTDEILKEHRKYLQQYGVKNLTVDELSEEDDILIDESKQTERGQSWGKDSSEVNPKDTISKKIKMIVASAYRMDKDGNPELHPLFGLKQGVEFNKTISLLINSLAQTKPDIQSVFGNLKQLATRYPEINSILNRLRPTDELADYYNFDNDTINIEAAFTQNNKELQNQITELVQRRALFVRDFADSTFLDFTFLLEETDEKEKTFRLINANQETRTMRGLRDAKTNFLGFLLANDLNITPYEFVTNILGVNGILPNDLNKSLSFGAKADTKATISTRIENVLNQIKIVKSNRPQDDAASLRDYLFEANNEDAIVENIKIILESLPISENNDLQILGGENKLRYQVSVPSAQTIVIDGINRIVKENKTPEKRKAALMQEFPHLFNVYSAKDEWLAKIIEDGAELKLSILESKKIEGDVAEAVDSLNKFEMLSLMINSGMQSLFPALKHSSRTVFYAYTLANKGDDVAYNSIDIEQDKDKMLANATVYFLNALQDEVRRSAYLAANGVGDNISNYAQVASQSPIFTSKGGLISESVYKRLLDKYVEKKKDGKSFAEEEIKNPDILFITEKALGSALFNEVRREIESNLKRIIGETESYVKDLLNPTNEKESLKLLPSNFSNEVDFSKNITYYTLKTMLNHISETKLFVGDFGLYKSAEDLSKRLGTQSSTGKAMLVYDEINDLISQLNRRDKFTIEGREAIYKEGKADGTATELIVRDFKTISPLIESIQKAINNALVNKNVPKEKAESIAKKMAEKFQGYVENDGISYVNLYSLREQNLRLGQWNGTKQNDFELQLDVLSAENTKELNKILLEAFDTKEEDVNAWFENKFTPTTMLKLQYVGPNYGNNSKSMSEMPTLEAYKELPQSQRMSAMAVRKTAYMPLNPTQNLLIVGQENNSIKIDKLINDELHKFLLERGIDLLHYTGAAKVATTQTRGVYNEDGTINLNEPTAQEVGLLDYRFMKQQFEINAFPKGKSTDSTQGRSTKVEGRNLENNNSIDLQYKNIYTAKVKRRINKLLNDLKIENEKFPIIGNEGKAKLIDKLVQQAIDLNSPQVVINTLKEFLSDEVPYYELTPTPQRIENILNSVAKDILKIKRTGEAVPQTPETGFTTTPRTFKDGNVTAQENSLAKFSEVKDGKIQPIIISVPINSHYINKLSKKYNTKNIVEIIARANEDLRRTETDSKYHLTKEAVTFTGLRVPNQQFSSNAVFQIGTFLMPNSQSYAVVPGEIVVMMGSDFDIDKVFFYYPNLDSQGNVISFIEDRDKAIRKNFYRILNDYFPEKMENYVDLLLENKELARELSKYTKEKNEVKDLLKQLLYYKEEYGDMPEDIADSLDFDISVNKSKKQFLVGMIESIDIDKFISDSDLTDAINEFIAENETELNELSIYELNNEKALDNKLLNTEIEILSDVNNADLAFASVDDSQLKDIYEQQPNSLKEQKTPSFAQTIQPVPQHKITMTMLAGKIGVGIVATWVTFANKSQFFNLKLNEWYKSNLLDSEISTELNIEGIESDISKEFTSDFKSKIGDLSAYLTSQVDLEKDPYALILNLTNKYIGMASYLTLRGVSQENAIAFINNSIVRKYIDVTERNQIKNDFKSKLEVIQEVTEVRFPRLNKQNEPFTLNDFYDEYRSQAPTYSADNINNIVTKGSSLDKALLLFEFMLLEEQTMAANDVKSYIAFDTTYINNSETLREQLYEKYKKVLDSNIMDITNIINPSTYIGQFKRMANLQYDMFKNYSLLLQPKMEKVMSKVRHTASIGVKSSLKTQMLSTLNFEFVKYLIQKTNPEFTSTNLNNILSYVKKEFDTIISDTKHPLHHNMLIKGKGATDVGYINVYKIPAPAKNKDADLGLRIALRTKRLDTSLNNELSSALKDIKFKHPALYKAILMGNLLQNGVQSSPFQINPIFDTDYISQVLMNDALKNLITDINKNESFIQDEEIIAQFLPNFFARHPRFLPKSLTNKQVVRRLKDKKPLPLITKQDGFFYNNVYLPAIVTYFDPITKQYKKLDTLQNFKRTHSDYNNYYPQLDNQRQNMSLANEEEPIKFSRTSPQIISQSSSDTPIFNSLPSYNPAVRTMTYAGIGSRQTPSEILKLMTEAAKFLESKGYTLNTGTTFKGKEEGADKAFSDGTNKKNLFSPDNVKTTDKEYQITKEIHPNWEALTNKGLGGPKLMARNTNQVFGENLDTPVDFVLFYAKETNKKGKTGQLRPEGGTGQAVEMARAKGIPTINMADSNWKEQLNKVLNAPTTQPQTTEQQPTTVEQNVQTSPQTQTSNVITITQEQLNLMNQRIELLNQKLNQKKNLITMEEFNNFTEEDKKNTIECYG